MCERKFAIWSPTTKRLSPFLYDTKKLAQEKCTDGRQVVTVDMNGDEKKKRRSTVEQDAKIAASVASVSDVLSELAALRARAVDSDSK